MELFQTSKNLHQNEKDSSIAKLLRERSSIAASMKSINDVLRFVLLIFYLVSFILIINIDCKTVKLLKQRVT